MKSLPTVLLSTLKNNSTSSVVEERGCSGAIPLLTLNICRQFRDSVSATRGTKHSHVSPLTLDMSLVRRINMVTTKLQSFLIDYSIVYMYYSTDLFTSIWLKSLTSFSACQGIQSSRIKFRKSFLNCCRCCVLKTRSSMARLQL